MPDQTPIEHRVFALEQAVTYDSVDRANRTQVLDAELLEIKTKIDNETNSLHKMFTKGLEQLHIRVFGNGQLEGSLCWDVEVCKKQIAALDNKLNQVLQTDNWRRELLLKAISSVLTSGLVLGGITLLKHLGKG